MSTKDMGVRDFKRNLQSLERTLLNKTLKKGQRAGAKVLAVEMRRTAPVESGLTKRSIKVRAGKRRKGKTTVGVEIASGNDLYYIGMIEFGTRKWKGNPFIRRAVAVKRAEVLAAIGEAIDVEIHKGYWVKYRGIST